ncbi:TPA: hypothetical protein I8235_000003 [Kluyvera intermedia]|nr:hypothetical protein [Kluyvera intermedia]
MDINTILLIIITFLLYAIYNRIGSKPSETYVDGGMSDDLKEEMRAIREELERLNSSVESINYTTDIIEKYRLPDAQERKMIDEIRIDNEISEMMDKNRNK